MNNLLIVGLLLVIIFMFWSRSPQVVYVAPHGAPAGAAGAAVGGPGGNGAGSAATSPVATGPAAAGKPADSPLGDNCPVLSCLALTCPRSEWVTKTDARGCGSCPVCRSGGLKLPGGFKLPDFKFPVLKGPVDPNGPIVKDPQGPILKDPILKDPVVIAPSPPVVKQVPEDGGIIGKAWSSDQAAPSSPVIKVLRNN